MLCQFSQSPMSPNLPQFLQKHTNLRNGLRPRAGLSIEQLKRSSASIRVPQLFPAYQRHHQRPLQPPMQPSNYTLLRLFVYKLPVAILCVFVLLASLVALSLVRIEQNLTPIEQQVLKEIKR
jgi:hypothetical protein